MAQANNLIRVDDEVYSALAARKSQGDTFNGVVADLIRGVPPETAETLAEEWKIAADDERGAREARVAYREAAKELLHNVDEEDTDD
jgi:predicted CopG family antitoxin